MAGVADARTYRWVDDGGVVHYTDSIPPGQIEKGHTELNEDGVRVETVAPAKTVEELQRERELERLRAQQERLIAQQNASDQVLLRTFRSVDDLMMAREGKLAAIDVVISVARSNIRRQQERLRKLRADAADLERVGKPIPAHLEESINKTERYIRDAYASIVEREQQKEVIRADFDRDLQRFRALRDISESKTVRDQEQVRPALRNLIRCDGVAECATLWARALAYVRSHATTPVQTSGPNILITAPPETKDDLSLTLSLIQDKDSDSASLFLDMQCKGMGGMDTTCKDARALSVLDGFRPAVLLPHDAATTMPESDVAPSENALPDPNPPAKP